jgi:hypothetical protein
MPVKADIPVGLRPVIDPYLSAFKNFKGYSPIMADSAKGLPSISFKPGVGTLGVGKPSPNLKAKPSGQPVPIRQGLRWSKAGAGNALAAAATIAIGLAVSYYVGDNVDLAPKASEVMQIQAKVIEAYDAAFIYLEPYAQPCPDGVKSRTRVKTRRKKRVGERRTRIHAYTRTRDPK